MKIKNIIKITFCNFLMASLLFGCGNNNNENIIKSVSNNYDVETIWEEKVKYLCALNCKDFDNPQNLKEEDILKVCQYYKSLSDSNIEYNEEIKKYIISEIEVKDIVDDLLGLKDFIYDDPQYYDNNSGIYFFSQYIGFFDDSIYKDKNIKKLDDQRFEFIVTIVDSETNKKRQEVYILKQRDDSGCYITSKKTVNNI